MCLEPNAIADATAQIADPSYEAHLRHRGFVRARPCPHIANLSYLTFRLLIRVVHFLAKWLAVDVLYGSGVRAKELFHIRIANGNELPVADVDAKHVKIAVQEPAFTMINLV